MFLFNDALNTFHLRLYGVGHMVKDHSDSESEKNHCHLMGYSFQVAASVLLYVSSHIQDNTYHSLCYTSRGALTGTRNSSSHDPMKDRSRLYDVGEMVKDHSDSERGNPLPPHRLL